jgi:hypothetical protein
MRVFDFDKTLTLKDTTLDFFCHGLGSTRRSFCILYYFTLAVCVKIHLIDVQTLKSVLLKWRFKNIDSVSWEKHCKEFAKTIVTNELFAKTNWKEENLVIVSASFQAVLKHLFPTNVKIIATLVSVENNSVVIIDHLYQGRKRTALEENGIHSIDEFYTDSLHDRSVMQMAKVVFLVCTQRLESSKKLNFNKFN